MAIRIWAARPDDTLEVQDDAGQRYTLPVISREQMRDAYMDGEALQARAGGVFTAYVQRVRTGVPNEMVTVAAVFEWKDRADARPQPEDGAPVLRPAAATPPAEIADEDLAAVAAEMEAPVDVEPDDPGEDPDEDLSAIPPHLREAVA